MWSKMLLLSFNIFILLALVDCGESPIPYSPAQPIMQTFLTQNMFISTFSTDKPQLSPTTLPPGKAYVDSKIIFPTEKSELPSLAAPPALPPTYNNRSTEVNRLIFKVYVSKFEFRMYDISDVDTRFI